MSKYRKSDTVHTARCARCVPLAFLMSVLSATAIAATTDDEAGAYLGKVEKRIMAAWKLPPKSDGLKVTLRYTLAANGSVSSVRVEKSSGNQTFDDSAVQAVQRASPFPAPPKYFPTGDLRMVLDPTLPVAPQGLKRTLRQQQSAYPTPHEPNAASFCSSWISSCHTAMAEFLISTKTDLYITN